jgi:hypothetical protein
MYNEIDATQRARWGFEDVAPGTALPAAADLATVATAALDAVLRSASSSAPAGSNKFSV